ncbi:putative RELT-like protein 1 [Scophthalmus maximus]|uniref:Putative RELT-like protein 1 n=1 Tax=Scophthalmus maximus TaxID=52904 RepID=A0A2U9B0Y1_SCOMX|nr:putative RELT-like protein 1 [Scophthalmus maximus]
MPHVVLQLPSTAGETTVNGKGEAAATNPDYIAFVLVPVFFLLGLLGVVICHVLKRKGYRCTTESQDGDEDVFEEEKDSELGGELNDTMSENNDTVGQIVHYIMKNQANSEALKAMINENSFDSDGPPLTPTSPASPTSPTSPMTPVSPGAPAGAAKHTCNHLHTIAGLGGNNKNICNRCSQKKWPLMRRPSARKSEQRRSGEVTVLAVGRFRVTKCERATRERRTLLIADSNGSVPASPTEVEPKSPTTSESQQVQADSSDKENR